VEEGAVDRFRKRVMGCLLAAAVPLSAAGCGMMDPEPIRFMADLTASYNGVADGLATVKDPESARAATPRIDNQFARLCQLMDRMPELARKHANTKVPKTRLAQVTQSREQAEKRFKDQLERVRQIPGLPLEFWQVVRMRSLDLVVSGTRVIQSQGAGDPAAIQFLSNARDFVVKHGHEKVVSVSLQNLPANLSERALEKLRAAAPGATILHYRNGDLCDVFVGPVNDFRALVAAIDFGQIKFQNEGQRTVEVTVDRLKLGARASTDEEENRLRQADAERMHAENLRRMAEAQAAIQGKLASGGGQRRLPDRNDPEYFPKLAEQMVSKNPFERGEAIDALLQVKPDDSVPAEARKQIARNFKDLATDGGGPDREKGIKGMVVWGGKHSVPFLLDLLDEPHSFVAEHVFRALGELKDERAGTRVAAKLGDFFLHQHAVSCLRRMGPAAEPALLQIAPSNDPKKCLAAIQLLGDVGTEKSLAKLRDAMQSRNVEVRAAAKLAIQQIRQRATAAPAEQEVDQ
jgi:hypothetical protein